MVSSRAYHLYVGIQCNISHREERMKKKTAHEQRKNQHIRNGLRAEVRQFLLMIKNFYESYLNTKCQVTRRVERPIVEEAYILITWL